MPTIILVVRDSKFCIKAVLPILLSIVSTAGLLSFLDQWNSIDVNALSSLNATNVTDINNTTGIPHTVRVAAGGGNISVSINQFSPKQLNIKVGDNVTWYNEAEVPEPHTVTFVLDSNLSVNEVVSQFAVPNSTQFIPIPPNSNSEPVITASKDGSIAVLAVNTRVINPVVIDSLGDITYLTPNQSYSMDGTEKYINSGAILPEGKMRQPYSPLTKFTVTFEKAGTYDYRCIFHPWMTGSVIVK
jgi:plastocyanin